MKHLGTKRLETERLILRKFELEDANAMYKNWASNSAVTAFLTWPTHGSVEISKTVIADWIKDYEFLDTYQWAIVEKRSLEVIGSIGVVSLKEDIGLVHIGYCIGETWWKTGVTSEAFQRMIPFFMEEVGVLKIEARHDPRNPNSGKVMNKCGLHYEGTIRQSDKNNQGICDSAYYGLLAEEYKEGIKKCKNNQES